MGGFGETLQRAGGWEDPSAFEDGSEAAQEADGSGGLFVLKTPGQRGRGVDNEDCHQNLRPSLMSSFGLRPRRSESSRSSRIRWMASEME